MDERARIVQHRLVCPPSIPLPAAITERINQVIYMKAMRLESALRLAAEMEAEMGPVTEAELEALREVWPPGSPADIF